MLIPVDDVTLMISRLKVMKENAEHELGIMKTKMVDFRVGEFEALELQKNSEGDLAPNSSDDDFQVIVITPASRDYEKLKKTALPFTDENCIVWLWSSNRFLPSSFSLLSLWDLQFQTMLTWVKTKKSKSKWLLNQTEHCILATRGEPHANLTTQSSVLIASAPKDRNLKPPEFFAILNSLFKGKKIVLVDSNFIAEQKNIG